MLLLALFCDLGTLVLFLVLVLFTLILFILAFDNYWLINLTVDDYDFYYLSF